MPPNNAKESVECKHCGLLKSTIDATGHLCSHIYGHEFGEKCDKNGHAIDDKGNLVFDPLCNGCDAPQPVENKIGTWEERFDDRFTDIWWAETYAEARIGDVDTKSLKSFIRAELLKQREEIVERRDTELKSRIGNLLGSIYENVDRIEPFYENGIFDCFNDKNFEAHSYLNKE